MSKQFEQGVAIDPRSDLDKSKDWQAEEVLGASAPYIWKEFNEADIPQYTIRNQNGSGECGAFSAVKALGINNKPFQNLRPEFIYTKRKNNGAGMYMQDMFDIACKYGAPTDHLLKGDNLTEEEANRYVPTGEEVLEALKYRGKNYVFMNPKDIDAIAQAIDNGYTPIILLRCDISEWTEEPFVNHSFTSPFNVNHYNPCIYAGMRNGVKTIVTDDSWGSSYGKNGHRFVSESFILNRVEAVGYIIDLPDDNRPRYNFLVPLSYGLRRSADVKALQDILKYEGCLASNIESTGNYLSLTAQAVMKLQLKNQIASVKEITDLQGRRVGVKTLLYLKNNYAILTK